MKIDMFEHLANPLEEMNLESTYRLWRALPFISESVLNRLTDLLKEKGWWKQVLKQDFTKAFNIIHPESHSLITKMIKQGNEETNFHPENFETAMCEKFVSSFLDYYRRVIEIGKIAEMGDVKAQTDYFIGNIAKKAQFICTLNVGDVFTFADTGKYEEFTYNGHENHKNEVFVEYISNNEDDGPHLFKCENIWRPVIKVNLDLSKKEAHKIMELLNKKEQ